MNLEDAIKHCKEVAMDKTNLAQTLWDSKEKARCEECASEHRQLAEWLKDYKRLLEQEPSVSENPNNCEMRDATLEERESIDKYIKSISKPTGVKFGALKQEPSGDLISREAVLENAFAIYTHECGLVEVVGVATIKDLPSVKPQEPKAVLYSGDGYADGYMVYDMAECPNCSYEYEYGDKDWGLPFCPNCGQKLNWERSDKE